MTWALKRQISYILSFILCLGILGFLALYPRLSKEPTCADGKQNGNETGIDCGGSCALACIAEQDDISVIWARSFRVAPGRYNAVAYVTNHNKNAMVRNMHYRFRFGDENNVYIGKREGSTVIPPGGNFAIFEPAIDVGNSVPVYTTFEWSESPTWLQVPEEKKGLALLISDIELAGDAANPKLSARIKNSSLFTVEDIGVVAVLYGADGNAITASRTYVPEIAPLQTQNLYFTWPEPFGAEVIEKELLPVFDLFSAKLQ